MEQAISTGDLVLVNDNNDVVREQDVIAFRYQTDSIPIVHRVVEIENDEIHTKGDANKAKDFQTVTEDQVIGKVVCAIPLKGRVLYVHIRKILSGMPRTLQLLITNLVPCDFPSQNASTSSAFSIIVILRLSGAPFPSVSYSGKNSVREPLIKSPLPMAKLVW